MKIILADDHALFRDGMRALLHRIWENLTLFETDSFDQTLEVLNHHGDADLILLDLNMPGPGYTDGIRSIRSMAPEMPVIAISAHESQEIIQTVMALGIKGYLPKSSDSKVMEHAIGLVLEGGMYLPPQSMIGANASRHESSTLTGRQKQVLTLLGEGLTNKEICLQLGISERTVKMHITTLLGKFSARNRTHLAIMSVSR